MCSKLKFAAFVFFALGLVAMTIAPPLDTCSMKVSKIWVASLGRWVLNPLCGGLCPSQEYTCAAYSYGFGDDLPGWTETCRCGNGEGDYAPNPPCSGIVFFDPDLPGYVIYGCDPNENCGTVPNPRGCEQMFLDIEDCPEVPDDARLCNCEPLT